MKATPAGQWCPFQTQLQPWVEGHFTWIYHGLQKNMKEANEIKTWFNVPLDVPDDKIMFYEFLGLMFFWQARVGDWSGLLLEPLAVQTLANGVCCCPAKRVKEGNARRVRQRQGQGH